MTRGSSLSDDRVIALLNKDFVTVEVNLTDDGFPKQFPGMKHIQGTYENRKEVFCQGFATCVVLTPDGKSLLADGGNVFEYRTFCGFYPDKFLQLLEDGLKQHKSKEKAPK
jgi:hypothetical protein